MASDPDSLTRSLFKGGSILFIGLVSELGISFIAKLLIARVLGPVDYGAVALGVTVLGVTSTLCIFGLGAGIGRYLPRYEAEEYRRGVVVSAFQIAVPISIAASLVIGYFSPVIANSVFHDPELAPILRVFALAVPFAATLKLAIGVIRGLKDPLPKIYIQNLTLPITRFGAVAVVLFFGLGSVGVAWAYAIAYILAGLLGLYYAAPFLFSRIDFVRMHRELLGFSMPLIVSTMMAIILSNTDTLMLGYFTSTGDVGIYNVAYPVAQLLTVMLGSFGFLFMPILSQLHADEDYDGMKHFYQIVSKWVFMFTLPLFLPVFLFPNMVIKITFGPEYVSGALALSILSLAFFTHAIAGPNGQALTSMGRTRLIMYNNVLVGAVNVALNLLLIPAYSYLGAAIATAVSYVLLNLLYSYQLYRETGIHPFTSALIRPGIVLLSVFLIIYWVTTTFFVISIPLLVIMFTLFLVLYNVIILRFGGIEKEEIMLLLSFEEKIGVDLTPLKIVAKWFIK